MISEFEFGVHCPRNWLDCRSANGREGCLCLFLSGVSIGGAGALGCEVNRDARRRFGQPAGTLLIAPMVLQHVLCSLFASFLNYGYASFFECRKRVQVIIEKSSTTTRAYKFPPRLIVLEGPKRSMCKSSRGFEVEIQFFKLKEFLVCFPFWHASHTCSFSNLSLGKPWTSSFETSLFKWFIWMRAILLCQAQVQIKVQASAQAQHIEDSSQLQELWLGEFKRTGTLLLMVEKRSSICSKCHKLSVE